MAVPTSREEFKEHCLRRLGKGAHTVNITDEQADDRLDEALKYYADYHFDGSAHIYYKHLIDDDDKTNKYITLPANILGAVRIFPISDPSVRSDDLFNIKYQMALNDLYSLTSTSLVPYYMAMQHLDLISEMLVGQQPIRYERHTNILRIDMDWDKVNSGEYLLVEAYQVIDPEEYTDVWGDRWLIRYYSALMKQQWGWNMIKYPNMVLPGGLTFNGQLIYEEGTREVTDLEQQMLDSYSLPPQDFYG